MTQQVPPPPKSSSRNRSIAIVALVVGLVVGLVLGIFISPIILPTQSGAGTNNQVQVSGTLQAGKISGNTIYFQSTDQKLLVTASVANGQYSILLLGGQTYNVYDFNPTVFEGIHGYAPISEFNPFYVPLGVSTFTENLVSS